MNRLQLEKRVQILSMLCEGSSMRSISRVVDVSINTVTKLQPDPQHISTSYVERQNLTMRMTMRRFTRLTNGFSKKVDNLKANVALHYMHYNFGRIYTTLRVTPAMAAGKADHVWSLEELAALAE